MLKFHVFCCWPLFQCVYFFSLTFFLFLFFFLPFLCVSRRFADSVNLTLSSLRPIHCTRRRKVEVEFDMTTIPAFLVVVLVLWFVLKPRRPKPKINWLFLFGMLILQATLVQISLRHPTRKAYSFLYVLVMYFKGS